MNQLETIPFYIEGVLKSRQVYQDSIKLAVQADLSAEGEYCEAWLIITQDKLIVVTGPVMEKHEENSRRKKILHPKHHHSGMKRALYPILSRKLKMFLLRD